MDKTSDQSSPNVRGTRVKHTHLPTVLILILIVVLAGSGFFAYRSAVDRQKQIWDKAGQINAQVGQINAQVGQINTQVGRIKSDLDQVKAQTSSLESKVDQMQAEMTKLIEAPEKIVEAPPVEPRKIGTLADILPEAPVLTTALTRDGYNYTAYFRNILFDMEGSGWVKAAEGRFRFSLEKKGPTAFRIRVLGRPSGPYLEVKNEQIRPAEARPGPLDGIGDFDGNLGEYYQDGKFYSGQIRLTALSDGGFIGLVDLTLHGSREDGLFQAAREFAVFLEPVENVNESKPFRPETEAWKKYCAFLEELAKPRYRVVTYSEAVQNDRVKNSIIKDRNRVTIFLRHDMDLTMYGAMAMAAQEHRLGLKGNYFINMASGIYAVMAPGGRYRANPAAIENLLFIQGLGHEIGYHTDVLMQTLFYDVPLRGWLLSELGRLRRNGLRIQGEAENGSPYCSQIGALNRFAYSEFRQGGALYLPPSAGLDNGVDGLIKYERDGLTRAYRVPDLTRSDVGIKVSSYWIYSNQKPIGEHSDVDGLFPKDPVTVLKNLKPGSIFEVMVHPSTWTTSDPEFNFVIDPNLT